MTFVYTHPYYPLFVVDAEDPIKAAAHASAFIKACNPQLDLRVADLCEYKVHALQNSVYCGDVSWKR
jgi:hypothetical protein